MQWLLLVAVQALVFPRAPRHTRLHAEEPLIDDQEVSDALDEALNDMDFGIEDEKPQKRDKREGTPLEELEIGEAWYEGVVMGVTSYGAFVDIGAVSDGLVHISELSGSFVDDVSKVVAVGDKVRARVLKCDLDKMQLSLSMREPRGSPQPRAVKRRAEASDLEPFLNFDPTEEIDGKVVSIKPFGAFVNIADNVDGLVHISRLSDRRVENVEDEVQVGQSVKVRIINVDMDRVTLGLAMDTYRPPGQGRGPPRSDFDPFDDPPDDVPGRSFRREAEPVYEEAQEDPVSSQPEPLVQRASSPRPRLEADDQDDYDDDLDYDEDDTYDDDAAPDDEDAAPALEPEEDDYDDDYEDEPDDDDLDYDQDVAIDDADVEISEDEFADELGDIDEDLIYDEEAEEGPFDDADDDDDEDGGLDDADMVDLEDDDDDEDMGRPDPGDDLFEETDADRRIDWQGMLSKYQEQNWDEAALGSGLTVDPATGKVTLK